MKQLHLLLLNILLTGAFGVILAYAMVGLIGLLAGHLYFGYPAHCSPSITDTGVPT